MGKVSMKGVIDMHVHTNPDLRHRAYDDFELMEAAIRVGARAIVIKTHQGTTMDRAYLCNRHNEIVHGGDNDFTMFGSITLNRVVGGINHGDNSSVNLHYSGTMGVVIEGCLKGVPSIGFSLCNHEPNADFEPAGPYIREIARLVLEKGLPPLTCLNVNFPDTKELKGVKICEQTKGQWTNEWENFVHRGDAHYYWLTGEFENNDAENEKNDHWALDNGYVAITPTTVDATAYGLIDELKAWF